MLPVEQETHKKLQRQEATSVEQQNSHVSRHTVGGNGLELGAVFTHTVSGVLPNIETFLPSIKTLLNVVSSFRDTSRRIWAAPVDLAGTPTTKRFTAAATQTS